MGAPGSQPDTRALRVCIYGGDDLADEYRLFISDVAYAILAMPAVIVTGGFRRPIKPGEALPQKERSTDVAALEGARRFAEDSKRDLKDCFEAWVPEASLDDRRDGVIRMNEDDGITLRILRDRTPLGRRLAMVAGVDVVVTIGGSRHTEVVIEQALELGLPVLPLPDAGGESSKALMRHRPRLARNYGPGALDKCLDQVSEAIGHYPKVAAEAVVDLMRTAKVGKCLVLFPYRGVHDDLYASVIHPAVAEFMVPVRLDHIPRSDSIYTSFAEAIRASSAVIVDITEISESVMYEVGYAHGHGSGLPLLIYTRDPARLDKLPVYFRTLNVRLVSKPDGLGPLITEFLVSVKRGSHPGRGAYGSGEP